MFDESEICRRYEAGETTQQLGACLGISHQRVNRLLRSSGVAIRRWRTPKPPRSRGKPADELLTTEKRFDRAFIIDVSGCWIWTKSRNSNGYGKLRVNGRDTYAHRYSYERFVTQIADGLTIDHLCRNRACVNPAHLEPVTFAENIRRRPAQGASRCASRNAARGVGHG